MCVHIDRGQDIFWVAYLVFWLDWRAFFFGVCIFLSGMRVDYFEWITLKLLERLHMFVNIYVYMQTQNHTYIYNNMWGLQVLAQCIYL